jgi:hypothetical protein
MGIGAPTKCQYTVECSLTTLGTRSALNTIHHYSRQVSSSSSPLPSPSRLSSRSRYDTNLLEATGLRETSPTLAIHDVKLLLLRFVDLQSFSEDADGGGRESNRRFIPDQIHAILYVLST